MGQLFDGEAIAAGAEFVVRLSVAGAEPDHVTELLDALGCWHPRIGRQVSAGAGVTEVVSVAHGDLDLDNDEELLTYLNGGGPSLVDHVVDRAATSTPVAAADAGTLLDLEFEVVDALHVGDLGDHGGNRIPLMRDAAGRPLLPGTSVKGVLRSRCEYILRSIGVAACLRADCGECPTCTLFGYSLAEPAEHGALGRRGLIAVRDTVVADPDVQWRQHVAIDRFTGGARDQALFETEVVVAGRLRVQVDALTQGLPEWTEGLLLAALADIDDGYVGVGGGTTRGQGTLRHVGDRISGTHNVRIRGALSQLRAGQRDEVHATGRRLENQASATTAPAGEGEQ